MPLDRSAVKAIVDQAVEPLMAKLGLGHWKVSVDYAPAAEDDDGGMSYGQCSPLIDYDVAYITLNPEAFDDESGVLTTLLHELLHVVHSPFRLFYEAAFAGETDMARAATLRRVWTHAEEKGVINLQRMFSGLTQEPEVPPMVVKAKAKRGKAAKSPKR